MRRSEAMIHACVGEMSDSRRGEGVLDAGWQAVSQGAWSEARDHFEAALAEEETAEALEGLGLAAWFLDDIPVVFDARERAYRLYRERDDRQGAARIAAHLAMDYGLLRAEEAVAQGWFQRAQRLLEGMESTPEHGFLAIQAGVMAIDAMHDTAGALAAAAQAIQIGRAIGNTDLEMAGMATEGVALVSNGQVEEGMRRLDEAIAAATAGEMRDPLMIGLSSCYMMFACERVRDLDRAMQWCERVKEFAREAGLRFLLSICRAHYGGILTAHGEWQEAEGELRSVVEEMLETMPGLVHDGLQRLAELRRRQGRLEEARELLVRIEDHVFSQLGLAAVALDRGDHEEAAERAERFVRQVSGDNITERAAGHEILVRARVALGDLDAARAALVELQGVANTARTPLLRAAALAAEGLIATPDGDLDRARRLLEDAVDLFRQDRAPFDAARARTDLARVLAELGRGEDAAREAEEALEALRGMGAEAEVQRAEALLNEIRGRGRAEPSGPLTGREVEVLRLVADGLSNADVAERLMLSEHTVKRHVANILTKLDVGSRAAAVAKASREGIL